MEFFKKRIYKDSIILEDKSASNVQFLGGMLEEREIYLDISEITARFLRIYYHLFGKRTSY